MSPEGPSNYHSLEHLLPTYSGLLSRLNSTHIRTVMRGQRSKFTAKYMDVFSRHGFHSIMIITLEVDRIILMIDAEIQLLKNKELCPGSSPLVKDKPYSSTLVCM